MGCCADIEQTIVAAKLGRARREAQVDCCAPFAAALYDALVQRGIECRMFTAHPHDTFNMWYHAVVEVDGSYYDSMGRFSEEIYRKRMKIHPKSSFRLSYKEDVRTGCYDDDMEGMYEFYLEKLQKSFETLAEPGLDASTGGIASPAMR